MRLSLIFITFSLLIACVPPKKPNVELCHLDLSDDVSLCGMTDKPSEVYERPLEEMENSTCFTPDNWFLVKNYMDELKAYIQNGCK